MKDAEPRYEYKTVLCRSVFRDVGKILDKKIVEMEKKGWEYLSFSQHGTASRVTAQFRKVKK